MERELENFLITNWQNTELGQNCDLIEEDGEIISQQYSTDVGIIDILAKNKHTREYVVIELKKNKANDAVIGQILRYMGWVQEHLADNQSVKGIIVCNEIDNRLVFALRMINNVQLFRYRINFSLEEYNAHT